MSKVSIIIATFNEDGVIKECLESLSAQSFSDFEVVVVDDGSTDSTLEVLSEMKITKYKLKIVHGVHAGAGAARNLGVKKSQGEILVFVDADMTFDRNFLENLIKPIVNKNIKGTFSKDEFVSNWDNVWARCWNINEGWEDKRRHPKNYPDRQPVFRAILKSEFDKVGGFTPGGYDDDWSLKKKLGYEAEVTNNAILYHKNPSSLREVFNHAKWVGKRKYKSGILGYFIALIRSSVPVSIAVGIYKGLMKSEFKYLIFKIVYDFGIFIGILEFIFSGKTAK